MSYFVTGTDTGVGKTLVSCALLHAFAAQNKRVVGFKPVAAGCDENDQNEDATQLRAASNILATYGQINPYCFVRPIAPHLAARHSGVRIELSRILTSFRELSTQADEVIVEGAGGFLIPLNEKDDTSKMAQELALPIILVVGMRLGCINHTLLTLRVIDDCGLHCAAWVANVVDNEMLALNENIDALQQLIQAPLLGIVPYQEQPDAKIVAEKLDMTVLNKDFQLDQVG